MAKPLRSTTTKSFVGVLAKHKMFYPGESRVCVHFMCLTNVYRIGPIFVYLIFPGHRHSNNKNKKIPKSMGKTTRVVLCGLRKVGKTAIVEQLIYGNINKSTVSTF